MSLLVKRLLIVLFLCVMGLGLYGCKDEGPMERAGKAVDEAVEDAGEVIEDAGESVEDAIEEQKEKNKE